MALPGPGNPLSISQIRTELGSSSGSLRTLSSLVGFSTPDAISEFYSYSNKKVTFSSWYTSTGSTGQANTSGTVTIVGASATFNAYASVFTGSGFTVNTSITINGNSRSASKTGTGSTYSTTFTLAPGTYSYNVGVGYTGTNGFGGGGIQYTQ